ncbi:hypothetical protein LCGC14_3113510 [marine sediment metagenome]|uniref:Uncharacterized protein n=1 Tax=marine sediment metagenome TaxID=412755 RepID=A0A0F8W4C7_9ZZZZ
METKNQTNLEKEYEEYLKKTVEVYKGGSCFDYKCKGKMETPTNPIHLLNCDVCGTALKRTSFKDWLIGGRRGTFYAVEEAERTIEYNLLKIEELKKEIQALKEENKENKVLIRDAKKRRKIFSRKMNLVEKEEA